MSAPHPRHVGSTYRLQLRPGDLAWAAGALPYLRALGAETLYLSPVATARPGSSHGYDVTDPTAVDPALGGWPAWQALLDTAGELDMGVLVDVVPNHLAASEHSPWWAELLRHGRHGPAGAVFDVDWSRHGGRVLVPVLGRPFDEVLAAGELRVGRAGTDEPAGILPGEAVLRYGTRCFPLDPASWSGLAPDPAALGRAVAGRPGRPATWAPMRRLLDAQHFRPAWWRTSATAGNYRRFFDIDDLAGVRLEDPTVRDRALPLPLAMAADRRVVGVRVDHIDGLADPAGFLAFLRWQLGARPSGPAAATGGNRVAPPGASTRPVVLVEKILARDEAVPAWPVDGTTGYELADLAVGVLVDRAGAHQLAEAAPAPAGDADRLARHGRRLALDRLLPGPRRRLGAELAAVAAELPGLHDVTPGDVDWALTELAVASTVYRSYVATPPPAPCPGASAADRRALTAAADRVGAAPPPPPDPVAAPTAADSPAELLRAVVGLLLLDGVDGVPAALADRWRLAVSGWQQLTGAVAAKGVEDTALYRFGGTLAQADVGAEPGEPAVSPEALHQALADRRRRWPRSLNTTSTHDSKRSEDVRARLAAATEVGAALAGAMDRWHRHHRPLVTATPGGPSPDLLEERQLYQTALGVWPFEPLAPLPYRHHRRAALRAQLQAYAVKAAREAKRRTSWTDPDETHEEALRTFVARLLTTRAGNTLVSDLDRLVGVLGPAGAVNSLALLVLKATAPGVPDVYQGCETWAFTLVDPDNRAPLDLPAAEARWAATAGAPLAELLRTWPDGRLKVRLTADLLGLRRRRAELFARGSYLPVASRGPAADHVVAFARRRGRQWSLSVVPRLTARWRLAAAGLDGSDPDGSGPVGSDPDGSERAGARRAAASRTGARRAWRPPELAVAAERWAETTVLLPDGAPTTWAVVGGDTEVVSHRGRLRVGALLAPMPVAILTAG